MSSVTKTMAHALLELDFFPIKPFLVQWDNCAAGGGKCHRFLWSSLTRTPDLHSNSPLGFGFNIRQLCVYTVFKKTKKKKTKLHLKTRWGSSSSTFSICVSVRYVFFLDPCNIDVINRKLKSVALCVSKCPATELKTYFDLKQFALTNGEKWNNLFWLSLYLKCS